MSYSRICLAAAVFATADVVGICRTRSVRGLAWPDVDGYSLAKAVGNMAGRKPFLVAVTGHNGYEGRSRAEGFDATRLDPVSVVHVHLTDTTMLAGHGLPIFGRDRIVAADAGRLARDAGLVLGKVTERPATGRSLLVLEGAGHALNEEAPEMLNAALVEAVRGDFPGSR